jgi:hypothetical protein
MTISCITYYPQEPLITSEDKEKLVQAGLPLKTTPQEIQNIVMKLLKEANRVNFDHYNETIVNSALKTINTPLRTQIALPADTPLPIGGKITYPLTDDERQKIATGIKNDAIRAFANKVFDARIIIAQLKRENRAIEKENHAIQEELLKWFFLSREPQPSFPRPSIQSKPSKKLLHPSKDQERADIRKESEISIVHTPIKIPNSQKMANADQNPLQKK